MADMRNLCEEVEIAIYSDIELSDEQKKHIENCESCRALLSQIETIREDLKDTSLTAIEDGEITKRVMESIRQQKLSCARPKFKITNHLGTAAAAVIILVAALVIKNPADMKDSSVSYDSGIKKNEPVEAQLLSGNYANDREAVEEEAPTEATNEAVKFKSIRPSADGTRETVSGTIPEAETIETEEAAAAPKLLMTSPAPKSTSIYDDSEDILLDTFDYASGGGGGSSAREMKIFAMEDFGDDLYENIEIANKILFELSGIPDYFKAENFESNEELLKALENFSFTPEN